MAIEWTEDLATGVSEIDNQHKEIFKRIDALFIACKEGRGKQEISTFLEFLQGYVVTHFEEEEQYMMKYQYPERVSHVGQHHEFIRSILNLKRKLEKEGPSLDLVIATNLQLTEWLKNHIRKVDTLLGTFLKKKLPA